MLSEGNPCGPDCQVRTGAVDLREDEIFAHYAHDCVADAAEDHEPREGAVDDGQETQGGGEVDETMQPFPVASQRAHRGIVAAYRQRQHDDQGHPARPHPRAAGLIQDDDVGDALLYGIHEEGVRREWLSVENIRIPYGTGRCTGNDTDNAATDGTGEPAAVASEPAAVVLRVRTADGRERPVRLELPHPDALLDRLLAADCRAAWLAAVATVGFDGWMETTGGALRASLVVERVGSAAPITVHDLEGSVIYRITPERLCDILRAAPHTLDTAGESIVASFALATGSLAWMAIALTGSTQLRLSHELTAHRLAARK